MSMSPPLPMRSMRAAIEAGRDAVAKIVGRDTRALDEAAVARSAIESLAENFSDGVVAPIMWGAVLGLPGMVAYKAINTADSMIGHRTPRHEAFGFAAAKVDDAVNIPASRLAAFLLAVAALFHDDADFHRAVETVRRDADNSSLAQCRMARSCHGRRACAPALRPARLSWRAHRR